MKNPRNIAVIASVVASLLLAASSVVAQSSASAAAITASPVPRLVNFSGVLNNSGGKPVSSISGVTFLLYKESQGGAPLWMETQNVTPDKTGHYTVQLGSTSSSGLPAEVFMTGEARWLAVQATGEAEQPRVLLVAVPYAMKAADAETVGGLPASAFVLAAPPIGNVSSAINDGTANSDSAAPPVASNVTTTGGTINAIPLFTTSKNIQNSAIAQTGTGATAKIGIGTTAPLATLDVKGTATVRGALTLPALAAATKTVGSNSQPENLIASSFSSSTSTAVNQTFQWRAEPAANNTANPSGTLNLLYGLGATTPTETGLRLSNKGVFTFAAGQTFPGTGPGTVSSVGLTAPATDFTVSGSPVTGTGTLNFAWKIAPTSTSTAYAIVKRDASGNFAYNTISAANLNATSASLTKTLSMNTSSSVTADLASSLAGATVVYGIATATTGEGWGVDGTTSSSDPTAFGVIGDANSTTGSPSGVYGVASSTSGFGVFGQNGGHSSTSVATYVLGSGADGGSNSYVPGVVGTSSGAYAGWFENNVSSSTFVSLEAVADNAMTYPFQAINLSTGHFCNVDPGGNLNCSGSKNAVVPINGGKRVVAMSAIEAPQNWFEDAGSAALTNGSAVVALDRDFIQTVNTELEYQVFLTPYGDCNGLYVSNRTANSFEVHELGGGASSLSFGYRIMAIRKNYEHVRFADHTNDPDPRKAAEQMRKTRQPVVPAAAAAAKKLALLQRR